MTRRFHESLEGLRQELTAMGGMAERAVELAVRAYAERDQSLCRQVFAGEVEINSTERRLDELVLDLLAMQQPMAVDLRLILAVSKCIADLERVGDQAVNIAECVEQLLTLPEFEAPVDLPAMAVLARTMLRRALNAFVNADDAEAQAVLLLDDQLDAINDHAYGAVADTIARNPSFTRNLLNALIIARNLERIGDHATNIAEDVIFWVRGADVRHHALSDQ
jgi:phosphate transport system protein